MNDMSLPILQSMTNALLEEDIYGVGYLMVAYSTLNDKDPEKLKGNFLFWLAMEKLASVPQNLEFYHGPYEVGCVSGNAAIVEFLSAHINKSLPPQQFLEKTRAIGNYITKHFVEADCCKSIRAQDIIDALNRLNETTGVPEKLFNQTGVRFMLLPSYGVRWQAKLFLLPDSDKNKQPVPMMCAIAQNNFLSPWEITCAVVSAHASIKLKRCHLHIKNLEVKKKSTKNPVPAIEVAAVAATQPITAEVLRKAESITKPLYQILVSSQTTNAFSEVESLFSSLDLRKNECVIP